DSLGNLQWQIAVDAEQSDGFRAVVQSADSNFIAAGGTDFSGFGSSKTLLCKIDSAGEIIWWRVGVDTCILNSVLETSDGNIVVGGDERSHNSPAGSYFAVLDHDGLNCALSTIPFNYYIPSVGYSISTTPFSDS